MRLLCIARPQLLVNDTSIQLSRMKSVVSHIQVSLTAYQSHHLDPQQLALFTQVYCDDSSHRVRYDCALAHLFRSQHSYHPLRLHVHLVSIDVMADITSPMPYQVWNKPSAT